MEAVIYDIATDVDARDEAAVAALLAEELSAGYPWFTPRVQE